MDAQQSLQDFELFKAHIARRLLDPQVPPSHLQCERDMVDLVESGLVILRKTERGFELRLTAEGEKW